MIDFNYGIYEKTIKPGHNSAYILLGVESLLSK
jgi:hypothetical protein